LAKNENAFAEEKQRDKNIVFIVFDDLNTTLGFTGLR
jgi:hypothetical protein